MPDDKVRVYNLHDEAEGAIVIYEHAKSVADALEVILDDVGQELDVDAVQRMLEAAAIGDALGFGYDEMDEPEPLVTVTVAEMTRAELDALPEE